MVDQIRDQEVEILESILNSRQLVLGWTDTKAQNLITASSILMAVVGLPIVALQPMQIHLVAKILLIISGLATLTTLSLSLLVTKFRFANQTKFQPKDAVTSIFGTITFLQDKKGSMNNLIEKYKEQLLNIGKSPVDYYSDVILLNSFIAYKKARYLNAAIYTLLTAVFSLGLAFLLIWVF